MKLRLLVIILHYGRVALTRRLHEQLLHSDPAWRERILVLDNHAPEPYPGAQARTPENLYWAGGLELAVSLARERGASHLWFLNNDFVFVTDPPHIGRAWGRLQRIEKIAGRVGVYSPSATTNPYHPQMIRDPERQYRLAKYVDGIAPLFSLDCLDAIGGVDCADNRYGYGVESVLSLRASEAGWNVGVDCQCAVRHRYHSTAKEVDGFLALAAAAERSYLTRRLGPDYKARLRALGRECEDFDAI